MLLWVLVPVDSIPRWLCCHVGSLASRCCLSCCCVCRRSHCGLGGLRCNTTRCRATLGIAGVHLLHRTAYDVCSDGLNARFVVLFNLCAVRGLCTPQSFHLRLIGIVRLQGLVQGCLDCVSQRHQIFAPEALEEWHAQEILQLRAEQLIVALFADRSNAVLELSRLVALEILLLLQESCAVCIELFALGGNHGFLSLLVGLVQFLVPFAEVARDFLGGCYGFGWVRVF